ncbi:MAG TPA: molybdopterin molybdotransferase MoeA [Gammaproteobacteria bacterium]
MTEVAEAERLIRERMPRFPATHEPLAACVDRVLAADVLADRDHPPFDRVTMDGIAVAYVDWSAGVREFAVAGTQAAGVPPLALGGPGRCVEVMTGAVLPPGADTVIPVERVERVGGSARVAAGYEPAQGQFIHRRGSDRPAGSRLLAAGQRIGPPEVAVLAGAGCHRVPVTALPRVAVVSTGDELVDVDAPAIAPHQIRSSNDWAIAAALARHRLGTTTRARLPDDVGALLREIGRLHDEHDVLILSGGVSMGQFDFVPRVLEHLGADLVFHRIEQRPGRPMWFGTSRDGKPIFALPGNPVSTLVCTTRYVLPALRAALGATEEPEELATLAEPVELGADLTYFMPVALRASGGGATLVEPRPTNTSGDFVSLAGTIGFVELPRTRRRYEAGDVVRVFRW